MNQQLIIDKRFCGPPNSGNGGYVCGMLDKQTKFVSEVTLRIPPPLEKELQFEIEESSVKLWDNDILVGSSKPGEIDLEIPNIPSYEEAVKASENYIGFGGQNAFPTCFVCGPDREKGDGLNIFAGKVEDSDLYAAPWIPDESLAGENQKIKHEYIWASLDCPGAYSIMGSTPKTVVLGRMTTKIISEITVGEKCVIIGWPTGQDGKKHFCGTAIFNESKKLIAYSKAIWFDLNK